MIGLLIPSLLRSVHRGCIIIASEAFPAVRAAKRMLKRNITRTVSAQIETEHLRLIWRFEFWQQPAANFAKWGKFYFIQPLFYLNEEKLQTY